MNKIRSKKRGRGTDQWKDFSITTTEEQSSGCYPTVLETLRGADQAAAFNTAHKLRKPSGIYLTSLGRVFQRIRETVDSLSHWQDLVTAGQPREIQEAREQTVVNQERMLYAIMEYLDDCFNILKTFFPDNESFKNDKRTLLFKKSVVGYRSHVAQIVNTMKHNQGRIYPITLNREGQNIPGYFIATFRSDGGLGPDEDIHKTQRSFSFPRDMRLHFSHIYFVGSRLEEAVEKAHKFQGGKPDSTPTERRKDAIDIAESIRGQERIVFPDDLTLRQPSISLTTQSTGTKRLNVSFRHRSNVITWPNFRVEAQYKGDGSTKSFKVPYY